MQDHARTLTFLGYHHKDLVWRERLQVHLEPMLRQGSISLWSADQLQPGADEAAAVAQALKHSCALLLLVSADYIASDESQRLLKAARDHRMTVLWLPVRPSAVDETELASIPPLLEQGRELALLSEELAERELVRLCKEIAKAVSIARGDNGEVSTISTSTGDVLGGERSRTESLPDGEFRTSHSLAGQKSETRGPLSHRNRPAWALIISAIGMISLPIAALGASITASNYQKLFVSIGAMGGLYLLFGLFFARISMFPEKHRAWVLGLLLAAFIFLTLALAARAVGEYYRIQQNSANPECSITSRLPHLENPVVDMACISGFSTSTDLNVKPNEERISPSKPTQVRLPISTSYSRQIDTPLINANIAFGRLQNDSSTNANSVLNQTARTVTTPKIVPESFVRPDVLYDETPHLPYDVKVRHMCQEVSGRYKICINENGDINEVAVLLGIPGADDDILAVFFKWKYRSQKRPVCFIKNLEYFIEHNNGCPQMKTTTTEMRSTKISPK